MNKKTTLKKEYTGSVYLGVVGAELEYGQSRDSIEAIRRRPGDSIINYCRATKGFEARQLHINNFIDSHHDFLFLLDQDQTFPADCLERLRNHNLPYVSGLYMRRDHERLAPIWFRQFRGQWPYEPWVGRIERGKLHPIGASGWGCVLIHRDVIEDVRGILKDEPEIIEDDMDLWPYDLGVIMDALRGMDNYLKTAGQQINSIPLRAYLDILQAEIRPLRGERDNVGSDLRFPFFALQCGYQLYGDPDVRCGHVTDFPLHPDHYDNVPDGAIEQAAKEQRKFILGRRKLAKAALGKVVSGE